MNKHAIVLGRKGGRVKSAAKTKAARENGKKGGRPKKVATAALVLVVCVLSACSNDSPVGPTPPPTIQPITLTGHVTATSSGTPLSGLAVDLGGTTAVTNGEGGFQVQTPPGAAQRLSLTGLSIVPRSIMVAVNGTREFSVDAIPTNAIDLGFYRQMVRNGFEAPGALQPLRRWTQPPLIYLKTVDETGRAMDQRTVDVAAQTIVNSASAWTGGQFGVAGLEQGGSDRGGTAGWITVRWTTRPPEAPANRCGFADVAVSGGVIQLYTDANCRCSGAQTFPTLVRHELGHAFGFWHTDNPSDVMSLTAGSCDKPLSARERAAAAIAYARPVGNVDPDQDPASVITLAPMRVP